MGIWTTESLVLFENVEHNRKKTLQIIFFYLIQINFPVLSTLFSFGKIANKICF